MLEAAAIHEGRSAYNHLLCIAQSNGIGRRRVDEVLGIVGLSSVAKRRAGLFSMGMSQRLGIGVALLGDPELLIFDEPVNGLDPEGIVWIRNLMRSLAAEGRTVFVSSHLMAEMALTADHVIVIGKGRLLAEASVDELIHGSSQNFVRVRSPENDKLAGLLEPAAATSHPEDDGGAGRHGYPAVVIGDLAAAQGIALHELSPQEASLEEAYMELTHDSVEYRADVPVPPGSAGMAATDQRPRRWRIGTHRDVAEPADARANVLASEWTKIRSVRSTYWTLLAAAVTTIGRRPSCAPSIVAQYANLEAGGQGRLRRRVDQPDRRDPRPAGHRRPRRAGHHQRVRQRHDPHHLRRGAAAAHRPAAKVTVFGAATLAVMMAACFAAFFIGQAILSTKDMGVGIGAPNALRTVVGTSLYLTILGLLALGIGTLIRKTAGAITAIVGMLFVLPVLSIFLPSSLDDVQKFLPATPDR